MLSKKKKKMLEIGHYEKNRKCFVKGDLCRYYCIYESNHLFKMTEEVIKNIFNALLMFFKTIFLII